jgi:hypothetical protein
MKIFMNWLLPSLLRNSLSLHPLNQHLWNLTDRADFKPFFDAMQVKCKEVGSEIAKLEKDAQFTKSGNVMLNN